MFAFFTCRTGAARCRNARLIAALWALADCGRVQGDRSDSAASRARRSAVTRTSGTTDTIPWPSSPCTAPSARGTRYSLAQLDSLAGRYVLTVVVEPLSETPNAEEASGRGSLELWQPDSLRRHYDPSSPSGIGPRIRRPIVGATGVQWDRLAPHAVAHSPASRDPDRPGVEIWENGMVVIGNSIGPNGEVTIHAGVMLSLDTIDASHFAGRWMAGASSDPQRRGFYCALRIDQRR